MQIIHVNLTQESPKPLEAGKSLDLTYSVKWVQTNVTFARRFDVYLDYPFFEHQVIFFFPAKSCLFASLASNFYEFITADHSISEKTDKEFAEIHAKSIFRGFY